MESGDEDDANFRNDATQKDWERMKVDLHKDGYRDGISIGKDLDRQKYFDNAYQLSLQHGFKIGQLKGIVESLLKQNAGVSIIKDELERIFKLILEEDDAAQRRPMLEEESFSNAIERAETDYYIWWTSTLSQLREICPSEKLSLLEKKWQTK